MQLMRGDACDAYILLRVTHASIAGYGWPLLTPETFGAAAQVSLVRGPLPALRQVRFNYVVR
jgi:hypothetical protein